MLQSNNILPKHSFDLPAANFQTMSGDKKEDTITPVADSSDSLQAEKVEDDGEIFKREEGAVDFRTVSWIHTSVIFLKCKHWSFFPAP